MRYALCATVMSGFLLAVRGSVAAVCTPAPSDMISWYRMEGSANDELGANNPSATSGVSFVAGEVGLGATFAAGGFIDVPHSASLAIQQITLDAWVRPDGPGPNNDGFGSVIILKSIDGSTASYSLAWSAVTNRFGFYFGTFGTEQINSANTFPAGVFYHVAGTYDGAVFRLYVNGALEGSFSLVKTIIYNPSVEWSIGSAPAFARPPSDVFPRTWNGVIDEVEMIDRALSLSEIADLYNAGSDGKCPLPTLTPTTSATPTGTPTTSETPTETPTNAPSPSPTDTPPPSVTDTPTPTATSAFASCAATPRAGCVSAPSGKIKIRNNADPSKRQLSWKWGLGTASTSDFGDPLNGGANYRLCVYDDGIKKVDAAIDADGTCDSNPCWKLTTTGRKYKHKTGNTAGIRKVNFKAGSGKAKILVKGKGANLANPLPFTSSTLVTVQFVRNPGGPVECWESLFLPPNTNQTDLFSDKVP